MRIVTDKDKTASGFRWRAGTSGSKQPSGRWWTILKGPDGKALTFADFVSIEFLIRHETTHANTDASFTNGDRSGIIIGIASHEITDSSDVPFGGVGLFIQGDGATPRMQSTIGSQAALTTDGDVDMRGIYASILPPIDDDDVDANPQIRFVTGCALTSGTQAVGNDGTRSGTITTEFTVTDSIHLFVANNWASSIGGIADSDNTYKIWYRINLARDGLTPTYIPGGGESG
tara:strand:- start:31 stop:723 length:693 start_codon:yes stop_codon:yes gene_type:complete